MTNDADHQGRAGIAECVRGPLDKLGKIVQKTEFDRVFRNFLILRKSVQRNTEEEPASNDGGKGSFENSAPINAGNETRSPGGSAVLALMQSRIHWWNRYPT